MSAAGTASLKRVLVMLESLAGTGHKIVRPRPKALQDKFELLYVDPYVQKKVLYREVKKLYTIKSKKGR